MNADINTLFNSDFYRIVDFRCHCTDCKTSKPEYSDSFAISFVRKGNFIFNVFRNSLDSYNGCILVTKPGAERRVTHIHVVPDECTIIEFNGDFYSQLAERYRELKLFRDADLHSTLIRTRAETEFLHFRLLHLILSNSASKLELDELILEILNQVLSSDPDYKDNEKINSRLKRNHLITIERAKEFMTSNFINDISLVEIAGFCYVSPFHFSRIFKAFTGESPYQFLLSLRLKNAELLLHNTKSPVADIAFISGFNSIEHFTASFQKKYKSPPAKFRGLERSRVLPQRF